MENTIEITIDSLQSVTRLGEFIRKGLIMKKINISQIARDLGVDRRTVKRYMELTEENKKSRKARTSKVEKHHDIIAGIVKNNDYIYIEHIYNKLKREHDVDYSLSTFKCYYYKQFKSSTSSKKVTARFETEPGFQAKIDYKENQSYIGEDGFIYKTDILALTLGHSRYTLRKVIANKTTACTLNALVEMFEELGGVPKQIVYDNAKALVTVPKSANSQALVNDVFEQFLKDFGIQGFACAPYRPETKGKVEVQMKRVDELLTYNGEFTSRIDISEKLESITSDNNAKYSQTTNRIPKFGIKKELENMLTLPNANILSNYKLNTKTVKVSNENMVNYKSNKYSVSSGLIGKEVQLNTLNDCLYIYYKSNLVCMHKISKEKLNYTDNHYTVNRKYCFDNDCNNTSHISVYNLSNEEQAYNNFDSLKGAGDYCD